MFLEYDWTFNVYRPRLGDTFISFRGVRSWETMRDAKADIRAAGLVVGRKTDSRTWSIDLPAATIAAIRRDELAAYRHGRA